MPSISIIIPTYHRPKDLTVCLDSILAQTRRPEEVLVIDDGALPAVPRSAELEAAGIRVVYHRKQSPGLTASRNQGIRLAGGELIFFLDDDVELFPDYVAEILAVYANPPPGPPPLGVGGVIANMKPLSPAHRLRYVFDLLFLTTGLREGRVLPTGFCTDFGTTPWPLQTVTRVDFLPGGVCSYRREVFERHLFSERYKGYGLGEDKDLSYRVSRDGPLLVTPAARLNHYESPQMRYDKGRKGREAVIARYVFFRDFLYRRWWQRLWFFYGVSGYCLARLIIWALSRRPGEWDRLKGMAAALGDVVRDRVPYPGAD
ncbi:MAG: glycosyltransferase family 2 protein [Magnetococcales bacterium]|nr:glycosyltransferase family 2 protein [Magnetococcales bacterium]